MPRCSRTLLRLVLCLALPAAHAASFDLIDQGRLPPIIHDDDRQGTMRLAAELVGRDLSALSGLPHQLAISLDACGQRCVVIGTLDSPLVQQAARPVGTLRARGAGTRGRQRSPGVAHCRRRPSRRHLRCGRHDPRTGRVAVGMVGRCHAPTQRPAATRWRGALVESAVGAVSRHFSERRGLGLAAMGGQDVRAGSQRYRPQNVCQGVRTDVAVESQYRVAGHARRHQALL